MGIEFSSNLPNAAIGVVRKLVQETELAVESPSMVSRQVSSRMRTLCGDVDDVEHTAVRAITDSAESPRLTVITHATDDAGERYGETVLGPIRDRLPRSELQEARIYTSDPVLNRVLRFDDPDAGLNWMRAESERYRRLRSLTDSPLIEPEDLTLALRRPQLPQTDRTLLKSILSHNDPAARIEELFTNHAHYDHLWEVLQSRPSLALVETRVARMDRAVAQPPPDSVRATRGLETIDHLVDQHGIPIGGRDPALLRGVVQKERGYSSTSLGAAPPNYYARGYRLELDLPAGSHGLWMGQESRNMSQRELILPRDLEYRIDEVIPNPSGKHYEGVDYLFRATVLPPGGS